MEVLGAVASAIGLAELMQELPKVVYTIRNAAKVDDHLMSLLNEVNSLQGIIELINEILNASLPQSFENTSPIGAEKVEWTVSRLQRVLDELRNLAQDCQRKKYDQFLPKAKRLKWIWKQVRLQQLQEQVKEVKNNLAVAISAGGLLDQRFQSGVLFEIRQFAINNSAQIELLRDTVQSKPAESQSETPTGSSKHVDTIAAAAMRVQSFEQQKNATSEDTKGYVQIEGTYRRHCDPSCTCQCHHQWAIRSAPSWMKRFLGNFFLSYNCLPVVGAKPCNMESCLNFDNFVKFSWLLPSWAWQKGLSIAVQSNSAFGRGARMSLEIPSVIPYSNPLWTPWPRRSERWMLDLLSSHKIRAIDVDESGHSIFYWTVTMPDRLKFLPLILEYYRVRDRENIPDREVGFNARKLLLDSGDDLQERERSSLERLIDLTDDGSFTDSRIHASLRGDGDLPQALLEDSAALDSWDTFGDTPLTLACTLGDSNAVATLIAAGANVNAMDARRLAPLSCACLSGSVDCVKMLLAAKCDVTAAGAFRPPTHDIIWSKAPDSDKETILRLLYRHGVDLYARSLFEDWPLQLSVQLGELHIFKVLVSIGADLRQIKPFNGWCLLHYVAAYAKLDALKTLQSVDPGALDWDVKAKNNSMTPVDVFKCASHDHGPHTHPDWHKPTPEETAVFSSLIEGARQHDLSNRIEVFRSAVESLENKHAQSAIDTLRPLIRALFARRRFEDADRLRLISLQVRQGAHQKASALLEEWITAMVELLRVPPLQVPSWVDEYRHVVEIEDSEGDRVSKG